MDLLKRILPTPNINQANALILKNKLIVLDSDIKTAWRIAS